ncbi:hypothetical protein FIV06_24260 [Labrenzia sp. THAF191b]|nr:hypothetical protein FIV06_24260 [Labrenzia sp. THAF191b]QFT06878.1 hypothetical protein FIV05_24255 [Labrenzia sp. THAF191a]QFT18422.1 hypothetical protein FIV03_24270 [Labrenzia sp. THAF187b]
MIFALATVAFVVCIAVLIHLQKPSANGPRASRRTKDDATDES